MTLYRGRGCPHCHNTGFHGRTGIFELLEVDDTIRGLINQRSPDATIRHAATEAGMRSMGEDGLKKVLQGRTTLEEVTRVVYLAEQLLRLCPSCKTVLSQEHEYCHGCGEYVGEHCEKCRRRLQTAWTFCPHCGAGNHHVRGVDAEVTAEPAVVRPAKTERRRLLRRDEDKSKRAA